jgi:glycosyltransferase involved in cell wall biosynthesis
VREDLGSAGPRAADIAPVENEYSHSLEVSLVLPVRDGEAFIAASLAEVARTLDGLGRPYELIVVSDGSRDGTIDAAESLAHPAVRVFHYPQHQGKGFAISLGLAQARGRFVGWLDADLDIHPDFVTRALEEFERGEADAVIGSKRHPESDVDYPRIRRFYSWGFQVLVRALFRLEVRDTQVGAKLFRREMLDTVLPLLLIKRYAFDVEVLAVGAVFGFDRVRELPVRLDYRFTGSGINSPEVRRMLVDTLAIAYRIHLRRWYVRRFASEQRERREQEAAGERDFGAARR